MKKIVFSILFACLVAGCGGPPLEGPSGTILNVSRSVERYLLNPAIRIAAESVDFDKNGNIVVSNPSHIGGGSIGWVAQMKIEGDKIIMFIPPSSSEYYNISIQRLSSPDK